MVRVYVNGIEVEVSSEATIKDAVEKAGFKVPLLCYLQGLFSEATCRICIVEVNGRYVPACRYPVYDEAKITTDSDVVRKFRRINIELLLAAHRIRCWNCMMKGGFCKLLELTREYGIEGIPVCSECPLYGNSCLALRGEPCLGPLTVAGCNADCTKKGLVCIGCRGPIESRDVIEEAVTFYHRAKIEIDKLVSSMKIFWSYHKPLIDAIVRLFNHE